MKKTKFLSFFLACVMALGAVAVLSSCQGQTGTTVPGPGPGPGPDGDGNWYDSVYFGGAVLTIDQNTATWAGSASIDNAAKYTMTPNEKGDDLVRNLCYDRNKEVEALLGLTLFFRTTELQYNEIVDYYDPLISTNSTPDIIINDTYPVVPMSLNGQLINAKTTNTGYGTNYFNLSEDCWYDYFMEGMTLDPSKIYGVAGDYFMDVIRSAHCLYLNTTIFENRATGESSTWQSVEDFYEYVEDGDFTYDDFMGLIYMGWEDKGTVSGQADINDTIGFLYNEGAGLYPFVYGSNVALVNKKTFPNYTMASSSLQLVTFTEKLISVCSTDGAFAGSESINFRDTFVGGSVMFLNTYWLGDLEFSSFRNMENKAAIVYPKAFSSQRKYRTYVHDSSEIGYIPITSAKNFSKASAFLQLVNEKSTTVIDVYFNEMLKYKDNTDMAAVGMLDVIHDSIDSSFNQYMMNQIATEGGADRLFTIIQESVQKQQEQISSQYVANFPAYENGLTNLIRKYQSDKMG